MLKLCRIVRALVYRNSPTSQWNIVSKNIQYGKLQSDQQDFAMNSMPCLGLPVPLRLHTVSVKPYTTYGARLAVGTH